MALAQADLRFRHNKEQDGLEAAERALSLDPNIAEAHCVKARYLDAAGETQKAKDGIETAIRLNPKSWETNKEAGRLSFRLGNIKEAIPYFEKAASLMETDFHDTMMLVTCYQALKDSDGVRRAAQMTLTRAEQAAVQDPSNGSALAASGLALAVLGDSERAHERVDRALLIDPDNLVVRYNLACTLLTYLHDNTGALDLIGPYLAKSGPNSDRSCSRRPRLGPHPRKLCISDDVV